MEDKRRSRSSCGVLLLLLLLMLIEWLASSERGAYVLALERRKVKRQ